MTYTEQGTRVRREWMPEAMANGVEWAQQGRRFEQLYRWRYSRHAFVCSFLYRCGFMLGKLGLTLGRP